jgi:hypothetical protein
MRTNAKTVAAVGMDRMVFILRLSSALERSSESDGYADGAERTHLMRDPDTLHERNLCARAATWSTPDSANRRSARATLEKRRRRKVAQRALAYLAVPG